jgi:hypothetical protein
MVERGKDHLGALCVVAAHLGERAWAVMDRGMPYVICDTDGVPITPQQAKAIIAEQWTVPEEVRRRRRGLSWTYALTTEVRGTPSLRVGNNVGVDVGMTWGSTPAGERPSTARPARTERPPRSPTC